ncbi:MAG: PIN domain-containing protein [Cyclobacteriaceae bacterium]|nr:PIN domain-containing protein [Cyclobacteriaceae bacterium HetDA_MAG_MS6]
MIIADTSVWIEFLRGDEEGEILPLYLKRREIIAISAVFGELLQGAKNRRERQIINEFWENLPRVDETDLFIEAGALSGRYKLISQGVGLIDCYLLAAGRKFQLDIWTLDKKLLRAIDMVNQ